MPVPGLTMRSLILALLAVAGGHSPAFAQTTGTVFGPDVTPGSRELEYRIAAEFSDAGDPVSFGRRLHYQQAFNDRFRWRAILAWNDPVGADIELDHFQGEILWQFIEQTPSGYSSGLRFDARLSEGDNTPHEIGLNWTHQWRVAGDWQVRGLLLADRDIGPGSNDDWVVETRFSISRALSDHVSIGIESFNEFGGLKAGFGSFDDQSHQMGPVFGGDMPGNLEWSAGLLFGISSAAPDHDVMFRLTRPLGR